MIQADGIRDALVSLGKKENTSGGRAAITRAIGNIARSKAGRDGLIRADGIRDVLVFLGKQENTPEGRQLLAAAIGNIACSDAGIAWLRLDDRIRELLVSAGNRDVLAMLDNQDNRPEERLQSCCTIS